MIIRAMKDEDLEQVTKIEKEIFSVPWSDKSFSDACNKENNVYLVCVVDNKVAGYCGMWTVLGEGNITNMAVAQEFRQQGIAKRLMTEMELRGRKLDVDTFFLEVRQSNIPAQKLYASMGYTQIGIRKRFYEKPVEDAIIMSKIYMET